MSLKESMRQAELNNWSLDAAQMADLCSSINRFFTATGVIPPQVSHWPFVCSPAGNMYMDSRQNISSLMGPPGYPHMPPMSSTTPAMTGDSSIQQQQHSLPPGHFQVRRMLAADDIQDDFDWDSIV
uniref:Forkhead box J3 n=1 Tax=Amphiprion percula TaxID=161767 RepID=A0A3P8TGI4_AMPPE